MKDVSFFVSKCWEYQDPYKADELTECKSRRLSLHKEVR